MSTAADRPIPDHLADLLLKLTDGADPVLWLRTKTRVDTGRWLGRSPLWLCATDTQIVLLAASKRRYTQVLPLDGLQDSYYSHATGQLVLEPTEGVRFSQIKLSPLDALRVLSLIEAAGRSKSHPTRTATENTRA